MQSALAGQGDGGNRALCHRTRSQRNAAVQQRMHTSHLHVPTAMTNGFSKASRKNQLILKSSDFVFDRTKGHEAARLHVGLFLGRTPCFIRRGRRIVTENRQRRQRYSEQNLLGVKLRLEMQTLLLLHQLDQLTVSLSIIDH